MSLLIRKPKTRKGKQILLAREPQLIENTKKMLFLEGRKCSGNVKLFFKDLYHLKKPHCKVLNRKNDITPFEDSSSLEFLTTKNDCGLFGFGSTTKKRPDNILLGRVHEHELLDMVELGINSYKGLKDFVSDKISTCVKPCLVFNGPKWNQTDELRRLRNLLTDTFQKDHIDTIRLQGIEHVLSFTCEENLSISMRSYKILLKKSGMKTPRIELIEIGPRADFSLRRSKISSEELYLQSLKEPKQLKAKTKKNISRDNLGNVHGRVHILKQDVKKLQTRRMKGLKK